MKFLRSLIFQVVEIKNYKEVEKMKGLQRASTSRVRLIIRYE